MTKRKLTPEELAIKKTQRSKFEARRAEARADRVAQLAAWAKRNTHNERFGLEEEPYPAHSSEFKKTNLSVYEQPKCNRNPYDKIIHRIDRSNKYTT
jgi:uncharacterized protein YfdQ (DUF2303 family)